MTPITTSRLVKELEGNLNQLGLRNQITLTRVPGHSGLVGNEMIDEQARLDSESSSCDPEPIKTITHSLSKKAETMGNMKSSLCFIESERHKSILRLCEVLIKP